MPKFIVKQSDKINFKENIITFWQECLPGTPASRFDWMADGNPAGPAAWFIAFTDKGDIAGMISVMPRLLHHEERAIRAGIMGDFMVGKKYRAFGPALQLMKAATDSMADMGLDFIYTIPNQHSEKLIQKAGFKDRGRLSYLAKPVDFKPYLIKHLNPGTASIASFVLNHVLLLLSKEVYWHHRGYIEEITCPGEEFDVFFEKYAKQTSMMISDRSASLLKWRYTDNPHYNFRIAALRKHCDKAILGYMSYHISDNCLDIYDLIGISSASTQNLVRYAVKVALKAGCKSIYITVGSSNPLHNVLKWNLFRNTKFDMTLYTFGDEPFLKYPWSFFACDRNI
jgi:hypothetical protein